MIELMYVCSLCLLSQPNPKTSASSARGNTSLESAVSLTKSIRWEIQNLGQRLATAANAEEVIQRKGSKARDKSQHERELKQIVLAIRKLLTRIEDAVPLINLAITASGASLSSSLPSTVSPSRLLQASTFLTAGDAQYGATNSRYVQIGPTFTLSMYMLFMGHLRPQNEEDIRESTWKEVIHKADVKLMRVPTGALYNLPGTTSQPHANGSTNGEDGTSSASGAANCDYFLSEIGREVRIDEYAYQLVIVEDLDDDRVHTFEDDEPQPEAYGDIPNAGIRELIPIHELSKIFYADTGKILNIGSEGEANSPVLLLKRDLNTVPPGRMMDQHREEDGLEDGVLQSVESNSMDQSQALIAPSDRGSRPSSTPSTPAKDQQLIHAPDRWRLPPDLDPEWIAFEVYTEAEDSDAESEAEAPSTRPSTTSRSLSVDPQTLTAFSRLSINTPVPSSPSPQPPTPHSQPQYQSTPTLPPIRTSLSLLETLLRLLSLQQFQQTPHLSIPDELLTFFLSESASTGAGSNNVQERKRLREEARRRVGFDPYDESPVKRRGEEYQYRGAGGREGTPSQWSSPPYASDDQGYERYGGPYDAPGYEDEGYHTYQSHAPRTPRSSTPQTSPLLLTNRSRINTPDRGSTSPSVRSARTAPARKWTDGLRKGERDGARRGSPLRPSPGVTDEGLGTSPAEERASQLARPSTGITDERLGTSPSENAKEA